MRTNCCPCAGRIVRLVRLLRIVKLFEKAKAFPQRHRPSRSSLASTGSDTVDDDGVRVLLLLVSAKLVVAGPLGLSLINATAWSLVKGYCSPPPLTLYLTAVPLLRVHTHTHNAPCHEMIREYPLRSEPCQKVSCAQQPPLHAVHSSVVHPSQGCSLVLLDTFTSRRAGVWSMLSLPPM